MTARETAVRELWRRRPRSRFLRGSALLLTGACAGALLFGNLGFGRLFSAANGDALSDFASRVTPKPLRGDEPWSWGVASDWAAGLLAADGWTAAGVTLAISVAAIVLASIAALVLCLPAARTFATPEPFLPTTRPPPRAVRAAWNALGFCVRGFLVFLRSIPEYVWAFLLFGILGAGAWPAVLALAIHNAGILGRLDAEVVENLPAPPLKALRALGARRTQLALVGVYPPALPRFLLYFFYRWETCVREATVLGMLGIASLGLLIDDARHRFRYDELVFWILVGAAIVLLGDLISAVARAIVRRA